MFFTQGESGTKIWLPASKYAQNEQNAFYILTPRMIEDILRSSALIRDKVYLVFSGTSLYVGCEQAANPFDPKEELPLEEQVGSIRLAAEMVRKARDILIHLEQDRDRTAGNLTT